MLTFISVVHILVALILILLVLMQDSKGGSMGMLGGGGSQSVLGATGAANLLTKATRLFAVIFAATCLWLTYNSTNSSKSVVDDFVPAAAPAQNELPKEAPAAPAKEDTSKKK